jgi:hypothetical protein
MRSYLTHPLVRVLATSELWADALTERRCEAEVTHGRWQCKNDATHMARWNGVDTIPVCFAHAVRHIEWSSSDLVTVEMIEKCEHNWRRCCPRHDHHVTPHHGCILR